MRRNRKRVIGGMARSRKLAMMRIVPLGSRGMKDDDPDVRSETARAMLDVRYATTPMFSAQCAFPPCLIMFDGYDRNGKRRLYCSPAHNTAACRYRQRQRGVHRAHRPSTPQRELIDHGS
jgi:hypothetical protein